MANPNPQPSEEELEKLRSYLQEEKKPYAPRPKWQIVMAWVLFGIVVLGIINLCYWQLVG